MGVRRCPSHHRGGDRKDRQEAAAPTVLPDVPNGLRTFPQQEQRSFLPFLYLQPLQQLGCTPSCAEQGLQIVGRNPCFTTFSTQFYRVASQPLGPLSPSHQLPTAKHQSCFSAHLLCLSAGSQMGQISLLFWVGYSQLELLQESTPQVISLDQHRNRQPSTVARRSQQPYG